MRISEVTEKDGAAIAYLIKAYNAATFDGVKQKDMQAFLEGVKFLNWLATEVASQLRTPPKEDTSFRITGSGSLPVSKSTNKKKKK